MLLEKIRRFSGRRRPPGRPEQIVVDFPECVRREFPREYPAARKVTDEVLQFVQNADLSVLSHHSPGLRSFDWTVYLQCSLARLVRVASALRRRGLHTGRVLDYGSYFGNFSLTLDGLGYTVEAIDSYNTYAPALNSIRECMQSREIAVHDFDSLGYELKGIPDGQFDAVICMGVVEHVPHTPRGLLSTLDRVLAPGGILVLDTPNLAYEYRRRQLMQGQSVFLPIQLQYETRIPFEGHHREYTIDEIRWLLDRQGHGAIEIDTFNYSQLALVSLEGEALEIFRAGLEDPSRREIILATSRKPAAELVDAA